MNVKDKMIVNDLKYTTLHNPYEMVKDYQRALNGDLPSDNVRVYVPMDINSDLLKRELQFIHNILGDVTEKNEYEYGLFVSKLISKIEIYIGYQDGNDLIEYFIDYLENIDGVGVSFPYFEIQRLEKLRTY